MQPRYVSPYARAKKLRSGLATASLVLGIFGLFSAGLIVLGSLIGIILAILAILKAKREPSVYAGIGIALGGIVTNSLGILSFLPWAAFVTTVVTPRLMPTRIARNEAVAIGALKSIVTGEVTLSRDANHHGRYASLEELLHKGLANRTLELRNDYKFNLRLLDRYGNVVSAGSNEAIRFEIVAIPEYYGITGQRSFYTCDDFIIRCADRMGNEALHSDPDLDHYIDDTDPPWIDEAPQRRD